MPKFERWNCASGRSLTFFVFKNLITSVNDEHWTFKLGLVPIKKSIAVEKRSGLTPQAAYGITDPTFSRRIPTSFESFVTNLKEFEKLSRSAALLEAWAAFEVYFVNIAMFSIQSNPGILVGQPNSIDGVTHSKYVFDLERFRELIGEGDFTKRRTTIERVFGQMPNTLRDKLSKIDAFRNVRNNIAHHFSLDLSPNDKSAEFVKFFKLYQKTPNNIGDNRFATYLKLLYDACEELDSFYVNFLGDYERILMARDFVKNVGIKNKLDPSKELRVFFSTLPGNSQLGSQYYKGLYKYVHDLG